VAHATALGVALAAWWFALNRTDVSRVDDLGLLTTVHPAYFVAPVACVAGYVAELLRGARRGPILGAYLVTLIGVVHATTPALLAEPQYAWTYRNVGAAELIATHGTVSGAPWPAFLTAVAQVGTATDVSILDLAPWAPVFFNLVASLLLFAIARALSEDRRTAYVTVLLFQCVNWVGQDSLAPPGFAFVLSLTVMLIVVRWLRTPTPPRVRPWSWLLAGLPPTSPPTRAGRLCALAALVGVTAALAVSDPPAPFLVAGSVCALAALGIVRPWWTALVVLAIPLLYLLPRYGSFRVFDGFELAHATTGAAGSWAATVHGLALVVWFLALLAAFRDRRAIGRVLVPLTLAFVPFGLVLAQSHGGEAIYRVYLYSAPWCAFLIADLACQLRWPRALRATLAVAVLTAMLLATVHGRHGQLVVDRQVPTDVAASRYLYTYGEPGAVIVLATPNFPTLYDHGRPYDPDLVGGAGLSHVMLTDAYLPLVERYLRSFPGTARYLVISDGMRRYAAYFGELPAGSLDRLDESLARSPQWTVFYRNPTTVIYQLTG
jgi:hypothetical protein